MTGRIKVFSRSQQSQVGLRFKVRSQADRVLHSQNGLPSGLAGQQAIEAADTGRMTAADRGHRNDLTVDQLHPVVLGEDPRLSHAVVFLYCEPAFLEPDGHVEPPAADLIGRTQQPLQGPTGLRTW